MIVRFLTMNYVDCNIVLQCQRVRSVCLIPEVVMQLKPPGCFLISHSSRLARLGAALAVLQTRLKVSVLGTFRTHLHKALPLSSILAFPPGPGLWQLLVCLTQSSRPFVWWKVWEYLVYILLVPVLWVLRWDGMSWQEHLVVKTCLPRGKQGAKKHRRRHWDANIIFLSIPSLSIFFPLVRSSLWAMISPKCHRW